jgi:hypothetical protein
MLAVNAESTRTNGYAGSYSISLHDLGQRQGCGGSCSRWNFMRISLHVQRVHYIEVRETAPGVKVRPASALL